MTSVPDYRVSKYWFFSNPRVCDNSLCQIRALYFKEISQVAYLHLRVDQYESGSDLCGLLVLKKPQSRKQVVLKLGYYSKFQRTAVSELFPILCFLGQHTFEKFGVPPSLKNYSRGFNQACLFQDSLLKHHESQNLTKPSDLEPVDASSVAQPKEYPRLSEVSVTFKGTFSGSEKDSRDHLEKVQRMKRRRYRS